MNNNRAIYLGTFDPLTKGHCDIILRASKIFTQLIIAIGDNTNKNFLFSKEERLDMIKNYTKDTSGISVKIFTGLAVDFAKTEKINIFIKGLRTEADYKYEMQMAIINQNIMKNLETIFIPTKQNYNHISSTLVKEIALFGGDTSSMVPSYVNKLLKNKFKQNITV
mgnify:CR=1 FL=1